MTLAPSETGSGGPRRYWDGLNARPESEFMVTPDLTLKRRDVITLVPRIIAKLEREGAKFGDRIFIRTSDETCAVAVVVACLLDGLIPVMVSAETPDEKAETIANIADAQVALLDRPLSGSRATIEIAQTQAQKGGLWRRKATVEDTITSRLGLDKEAREPRLPDDPSALAYILFTSGTTSDPAGVMISHGALAANMATIARVHEINETSRLFNDMILSHADGLIQGPIMALATGGTVIRSGGFSVDRIEDWLNRVRSLRCTHFTTVPTVWSMINRYCQHDDYFDAPELRYLGSVAAALPQELWQQIESRFGKPLISQYGLTETVASALYAGGSPVAGAPYTAGLPLDCDAKLDLTPGAAEGELLLRGDNIFSGYWKNDVRTAATVTDDGWLRTGDLAAQHDDGSYEIRGRIKTVIMSGGFLVRPEEIDDAMTRHPQVQASVTVGLPHPEFGEIAATALVCGPEAVSSEDLRAHAQTRLEALKIPKHFVQLNEIPRGDAGKPRLDAVRSLLTERIASQSSESTSPEAGINEKLLELAAGVFYVSAEDLSLSSSPETVEGWDSFTHISLILALEEGFGIRIPPHRAAALRSLGDAAQAVHEAS